jgi:serine protease
MNLLKLKAQLFPTCQSLLMVVGLSLASAPHADPLLLHAKAGLRVPIIQHTESSAVMVDRLIIATSASKGAILNSQLDKSKVGRLPKQTTAKISVVRKLSARSHLLKFDRQVSINDARAIAARLKTSVEVESAEPDMMLQAQSIQPTDPAYANWPGQWHYMAPFGRNLGGADLPAAWDLTLGSGSVNVAVIDTGYRPHPDLQAMLPGYDFISSTAVSNDGDGRDANASDPGDYVASGDCINSPGASASTWHGTHVMGTVAALMNNGIYGTGVAPNVRILPVRVLGRCGGFTSDIVDAMRWAAGIDVAGVPHNANPARVLNLSLGSTGSCSAAFQNAVNDVNAVGAVVVVATGNGGYDTVNQPANCTGVLAVTAHSIDGDSADYANLGSQTSISAPGGGCGTLALGCFPGLSDNGLTIYSLGNAGLSTPGQDSYALKRGTSMAVPHVSGTIALMLSLNPFLTRTELISAVRNSARPFAAGTACAMPANSGLCGAGMLDARAALSAVTPSVQVLSAGQIVAPLSQVVLSGSAQAPLGRSIAHYTWSAASSNPSVVNLLGADTQSASFTAPATGRYSFTLTAIDDTGISGSANVTVRVNSLPVPQVALEQQVTFGTRLSLQLYATDVDGDALTFHAVSLPANATLSSAGLFTWDSAAPQGRQEIAWYASDDIGSSAGLPIVVQVANATGNAIATPFGASSSSGSGGGGSMEGDLSLMLGAALVLCKRCRRS